MFKLSGFFYFNFFILIKTFKEVMFKVILLYVESLYWSSLVIRISVLGIGFSLNLEIGGLSLIRDFSKSLRIW